MTTTIFIDKMSLYVENSSFKEVEVEDIFKLHITYRKPDMYTYMKKKTKNKLRKKKKIQKTIIWFHLLL